MKLTLWQYTSLALLILVLILGGCTYCGHQRILKLQKDCDQKLVKEDTVTKHDTIPVHDTVPDYRPMPYKVEVPVPVYTDTGDHTIHYAKIDTAAILKYYYSTAFYSDTQKVKKGNVIINDEITQNRISKRKLFVNIEYDSVTKLITKTIEAKKKNSVWLGLTGQGNKSFEAAGPSLMFIHKKWGIGVGTLVNRDGKLIYQGSIKKQLK